MWVFQWKTGHISETVKDTAKVTINHWKEIAYALSDEIKIIDLKWPWKLKVSNATGTV